MPDASTGSRYREPVDADGWDQRYAAADLVWSAGPNRFVAEELADRPPGRVLDLASGEGRNALWLAARAGKRRRRTSPPLLWPRAAPGLTSRVCGWSGWSRTSSGGTGRRRAP